MQTLITKFLCASGRNNARPAAQDNADTVLLTSTFQDGNVMSVVSIFNF